MAGVRSNRKPPAENSFGTPEEIADRNPNRSLNQPYGVADEKPTSFSQIPPKSGGGSVNRAPLTRKSGDLKWSGGIGGA